MFAKQGKKGLRDQVESFAGDLADRIAPHVDQARDQIAPVLADARDQIAPVLADARDKAVPVVADAWADARDKATPYVSDARERFVSEVVPAVTAVVSDARDKAAPYVEEARKESRRRARATAAALKGEVEPPKKGGKLKKVLLAGGVIGLGAYLYGKLTGDKQADPWQSSYSPPAPPTPAPAPVTTPVATNDGAGASPDEALADASVDGTMHAVTTPDNPVEETDLSGEDDPRA